VGDVNLIEGRDLSSSVEDSDVFMESNTGCDPESSSPRKISKIENSWFALLQEDKVRIK
jgi:hypothetical protein